MRRFVFLSFQRLTFPKPADLQPRPSAPIYQGLIGGIIRTVPWRGLVPGLDDFDLFLPREPWPNLLCSQPNLFSARIVKQRLVDLVWVINLVYDKRTTNRFGRRTVNKLSSEYKFRSSGFGCLKWVSRQE